MSQTPIFNKERRFQKWQLRSRKGIFVRFSPNHGSEVPLLLNPINVHIILQFHVVFDDSFSTSSLSNLDDPPYFLNEFELDEFLYQIPLDKESVITLDDEQLTYQERKEHERGRIRAARIRSRFQPFSAQSSATESETSQAPSSDIEPPFCPKESRISDSPKYIDAVEFSSDIPPVEKPSIESPLSPSQPRRSGHPRIGKLTSIHFQNEVFNSSLQTSGKSLQHQIITYQAALETVYDTGIFNGSDSCDYAAGNKFYDPDQPSFYEALHGEESHHYET